MSPCVLGLLGCGALTDADADASADPAPPVESWSGCVSPCADAHPAAQGFGRCVAHFSPAESTVASGGFGHASAHARVAGAPGGSEDVVSVGCGGSLVVDLGPEGAVDGPGVDLIVFENPFSEEFPEPAHVWVSADGCAWETFVCDPTTLVGCAGQTPVAALPGTAIDPRVPAEAGGDGFDLADVGLPWIRFVRVLDDSALYWAQYDGDWCDPGMGGKGGFDLDAVSVVHGGG